jgi:hypothetical protein
MNIKKDLDSEIGTRQKVIETRNRQKNGQINIIRRVKIKGNPNYQGK